jgi:hypothetical protein
MTTNLNSEVGGSTASETLISKYLITRHNNPENHDFTSNYASRGGLDTRRVYVMAKIKSLSLPGIEPRI